MSRRKEQPGDRWLEEPPSGTWSVSVDKQELKKQGKMRYSCRANAFSSPALYKPKTGRERAREEPTGSRTGKRYLHFMSSHAGK